MRVARLYKADDIRIEDDPMPAAGPGEAVVRTRACGICTGDIMGWYMERKAPLVFGHEPAGEIVEVGDGVRDFSVGDRVFVHHHAPCGDCHHCRRGHHVHCATWRKTKLTPGGMAEYFLVARENLANDTLRLPDSVDFDAGSLVEPAACVVKSLGRAAMVAGETLLVIGLGIMGQLHVALAKAAGHRVIAADRVPFRIDKARALGADVTVHVDEQDLVETVRDACDGRGADAVVVGPGSIEAMETGILATGPGGRVVLFTTSQPHERLTVSPHDLYFDEISIVPSYSCGPDDTRAALAAIADGTIDCGELITHRYRLERVRDALETAGDVGRALKTVIEFG